MKKQMFFLVGMMMVFGMLFGGMAAAAGKEHKLVIQLSENDPKKINMVLNNAANVIKAFGMGNVEVEIVAYGPGLKMVHKKSKFRARMQSLSKYGVKFGVCANTMKKLKWTKKDLLADAFIQKGVVPGGVVRIMELQNLGYNYIRP